jgi:hypothetical protein
MARPIQTLLLCRAVFWASIFSLLLAALVMPPCKVQASVDIYDFTATPQGDSIELKWKTGIETNTRAFHVHRGLSPNELSFTGDVIPASGDIAGGAYGHIDRSVEPGKRYYYLIEEWTTNNTGGNRSVIRSAGIGDLPPELTATPTATATTVQSGGAATHTPTATNAPGGTTGEQPTATRQFTLTPPPNATAAVGSTFTPPPSTLVTATPNGAVVLSTPTGGPQPPTVAPVALPATMVPTPLPPEELTALPASPSPAVVAMSTVQTAEEVTPTATQPPQVFAAATAQPLLGTPGQAPAAPTSAPAGETTRDTGSTFLLGGGAILLAAAIGGGVLLYLRSRQS